MWNKELIERLENWYATPQGRYALARERTLFRALASGWPRRGSKLLQIGCGSGIFLGMLWEDGFDVTGFDSSLALMDTACHRLGHRADFRLGQPDYLPFEDGDFDYAVLPVILEFYPDTEKVLREVLRVTARSVILLFANRFSLLWTGSCRKKFSSLPRQGLLPWDVYSMASRICPEGKVSLRTIMPCPPALWKENTILQRINSTPLVLPIGSFAGIRIDKASGAPLTPLWLTGRPLKAKEETCEAAAMQSFQKKLGGV